MQSLNNLLELADGFKNDRSLYHNHVNNGVTTELEEHKTELLELIELMQDDDPEFVSDCRDDVKRIDAALSLYQQHSA